MNSYSLDLVFILLDNPDEQHDKMVSEHIMETYFLSKSELSHPNSDIPNRATAKFSTQSQFGSSEMTLAQRLRKEIQSLRISQPHEGPSEQISHDLLRNYIEYAKKNVHPVLSKAAAKVLQRLYLTMRYHKHDISLLTRT